MKIPYYKCKKCGKVVSISERGYHIRREHGIDLHDYWRREIMGEWFGKPTYYRTWTNPLKQANLFI